jgi:hypothetical protein
MGGPLYDRRTALKRTLSGWGVRSTQRAITVVLTQTLLLGSDA